MKTKIQKANTETAGEAYQPQAFLEVKDLTIHYSSEGDIVHAVNNVSFKLEKGQTIGLVGETGAGKTTIAKAILRILPDFAASIESGQVWLDGVNLLEISEEEMMKVFYVLLFLLSVRVFVLAGVQETGSNLFLGTIAFQIGTVCMYIWLFFILIAYLTSKREMEVRTYRETSECLRKCTNILCFFRCGAGVMSLLYLALSRGTNAVMELEGVALYGISAAAIFWMGKTERGIRYITIPNSRTADPEDVIIDY